MSRKGSVSPHETRVWKPTIQVGGLAFCVDPAGFLCLPGGTAWWDGCMAQSDPSRDLLRARVQEVVRRIAAPRARFLLPQAFGATLSEAVLGRSSL